MEIDKKAIYTLEDCFHMNILEAGQRKHLKLCPFHWKQCTNIYYLSRLDGLFINFHAQCILVKRFKFLWLQLDEEMEQFLAQ